MSAAERTTGATPEQIEAAAQRWAEREQARETPVPFADLSPHTQLVYRMEAHDHASDWVPPDHRIVGPDVIEAIKHIAWHLDGYKAPEQIVDAVWAFADALKRIAAETTS